MSFAVSQLFVFLIAVQHLAFLVLEMFLWQKPIGLRIFRQSPEHAKLSATLAANQGLYNGFLAAGLMFGLLHTNPTVGKNFEYFFLSCVVSAGLFGGYTVSKTIWFVQMLPALFTLGLLLII